MSFRHRQTQVCMNHVACDVNKRAQNLVGIRQIQMGAQGDSQNNATARGSVTNRIVDKNATNAVTFKKSALHLIEYNLSSLLNCVVTK
jgi:hypothetical protein